MLRGKGPRGWTSRSCVLLFRQTTSPPLPTPNTHPVVVRGRLWGPGLKPTGKERELCTVVRRETAAKSADCTADPKSARRRRRRGSPPSSLPAFSIVIGNPSRLYPSPRLAQSPSRTRLEQAQALLRSLKLEVTFWQPPYSRILRAGPRGGELPPKPAFQALLDRPHLAQIEIYV